MDQIKILQSDIAKLAVDGIVNAANESLLGGGGVDGAIHYVAGPELLEECKLLNGCAKGEAKITKGYNLPAKYVIHTVGPIYGHEDGREEELLALCYKNSLLLAKEKGIKTIAFSSISTGVYRYPKDEVAKIAVDTVKNFIKDNPGALDEIVFIAFDELSFDIYNQIVQ